MYLFIYFIRMTTTIKVLGTSNKQYTQLKKKIISVIFIWFYLYFIDNIWNITTKQLHENNITLIHIPCWWDGSITRFFNPPLNTHHHTIINIHHHYSHHLYHHHHSSLPFTTILSFVVNLFQQYYSNDLVSQTWYTTRRRYSWYQWCHSFKSTSKFFSRYFFFSLICVSICLHDKLSGNIYRRSARYWWIDAVIVSTS